MDIRFDERADALYIQFRTGKHVKKTVKLQDGVLLDIDRAGRLFGLEILDVRSRIPLAQLGHVSVHLPVHA